RESSPTARDDRWLRADRPSLTRLPNAYRHRKIPADPSSPPRIKISRIRFAQVGGRSYFSKCPVKLHLRQQPIKFRLFQCAAGAAIRRAICASLLDRHHEKIKQIACSSAAVKMLKSIR